LTFFLFFQGNVILADANFEIQTLLRTHKYDEDVLVATHQVYPTQNIRQLQVEKDKVIEALANAEKTESIKQVLVKETGRSCMSHILVSS
jgi:hypothetical protein